MIRRPPRSTRKESSAASDVYKRQGIGFYLVYGLQRFTRNIFGVFHDRELKRVVVNQLFDMCVAILTVFIE
jgi:alpha-D-ribose 1-methylphosphonate 5-triphosphate synthase subunit PhnL